jgi:hypothetical protein
MEHAVQQHMNSKSAQSSKNFFGRNDAPKFFPALHVQPKLTIGAVDDFYEREADTVAERVMRMPGQLQQFKPVPVMIQRKCAACEQEELQRKPAASIVQRDPDDKLPDLTLSSDWDDRSKRPPYVNHYQLVFAPTKNESLDSKINFGDLNLDLIQRGKIDPSDFSEDYANLWKSDYQLSTNLGLGKIVGNLYGMGGRLDTKLLKPVRKFVRKIPILSHVAGAMKYEPPVPKGNDWDRYVADKLAQQALDAAVSGDYAAYNSQSGTVITINLFTYP